MVKWRQHGSGEDNANRIRSVSRRPCREMDAAVLWTHGFIMSLYGTSVSAIPEVGPDMGWGRLEGGLVVRAQYMAPVTDEKEVDWLPGVP